MAMLKKTGYKQIYDKDCENNLLSRPVLDRVAKMYVAIYVAVKAKDTIKQLIEVERGF
jgi:hypothetical protein